MHPKSTPHWHALLLSLVNSVYKYKSILFLNYKEKKRGRKIQSYAKLG